MPGAKRGFRTGRVMEAEPGALTLVTGNTVGAIAGDVDEASQPACRAAGEEFWRVYEVRFMPL